jgi:hypothetical protein
VFDTWAVLTGIRDYFKGAVPTSLAKISVTDTVNTWGVGWENPYSLNRYDGVLFVAGNRERNEDEATLELPIDIYVAILGREVTDVNRRVMAYLDAIDDAWEADPSFAGNVFTSEIRDVDYADPETSGGVKGVAIVSLLAELDTLAGGV